MKLSQAVKMPEKKKSPDGKDCQCAALDYASCGCYADWSNYKQYNQALDELSSLTFDPRDCVEVDLETVTQIITRCLVGDEWPTGCIHGSAINITNQLIQNKKVWMNEKS